MTKTRKPPLGVLPRRIHEEHRLNDLLDAMSRYIEAGFYDFPVEWVQECVELRLGWLGWTNREQVSAGIDEYPGEGLE